MGNYKISVFVCAYICNVQEESHSISCPQCMQSLSFIYVRHHRTVESSCY